MNLKQAARTWILDTLWAEGTGKYLRRVTSLELIQCRLKRVMCLQTPTVFRTHGGIVFLSYCSTSGSDVWQTETRAAGPLLPEPSAAGADMVVQILKATNHRVLITFQQNWLKQAAAQFFLRSINLLVLFGMMKNCFSGGSSRSLYLLTGNVLEQTVVIIKEYLSYQQI